MRRGLVDRRWQGVADDRFQFASCLVSFVSIEVFRLM